MSDMCILSLDHEYHHNDWILNPNITAWLPQN